LAGLEWIFSPVAAVMMKLMVAQVTI